MKAAVIAHYHHEPIWDDNFLIIISLVSSKVNHVVVVTTRIDMPDLPSDLSHVKLIRRPNIGYDFYSYRVGLTSLGQNKNIQGVFILNSSFILLNSKRFSVLLDAMCDNSRTSAIRGVTASYQIAWHLQSYLLYFDLEKLPPRWLDLFFEAVQPVNSKTELILTYEIGLGRLISKQKIPAESLYSPDFFPFLKGALAWFKRKMPSAERFSLLKPRTWRHLGGINLVHFTALDLAKKYGFVKTERLCANPLNLPLSGIMDLCEPLRAPSILRLIHSIKTQEKNAKPPVSPFHYQLLESETARKQGAKIAVVLHLYYLDLLEEILEYLKNISEPFDLYITTPFEADICPIFNTLDAHNQPVTVLLIENRGRDIAPFIALYRSKRLNAYDAILKLHSKKSAYDAALGTFWRKELYHLLCGSSSVVLHSLALLREQHTGVVGPGKYFLNRWGAEKNKKTVTNLLTHAGIKTSNAEPLNLGFFAGSMFWFTPSAFNAIHTMPASALQFEPEAAQEDGTLAHAWERIFCLLSQAAGYTVTSLSLSGKDIFMTDPTGWNNAPKLPGFRIPRTRDVINGIRWIKRLFIRKFSLLYSALFKNKTRED